MYVPYALRNSNAGDGAEGRSKAIALRFVDFTIVPLSLLLKHILCFIYPIWRSLKTLIICFALWIRLVYLHTGEELAGASELMAESDIVSLFGFRYDAMTLASLWMTVNGVCCPNEFAIGSKGQSRTNIWPNSIWQLMKYSWFQLPNRSFSTFFDIELSVKKMNFWAKIEMINTARSFGEIK